MQSQIVCWQKKLQIKKLNNNKIMVYKEVGLHQHRMML